MLKTIALISVLISVLIAALAITHVNPKEPVETVTITKELAEKLVQSSIAQQYKIEQLKHNVYLYQMALHEERNKMCT